MEFVDDPMLSYKTHIFSRRRFLHNTNCSRNSRSSYIPPDFGIHLCSDYHRSKKLKKLLIMKSLKDLFNIYHRYCQRASAETHWHLCLLILRLTMGKYCCLAKCLIRSNSPEDSERVFFACLDQPTRDNHVFFYTFRRGNSGIGPDCTPRLGPTDGQSIQHNTL